MDVKALFISAAFLTFSVGSSRIISLGSSAMEPTTSAVSLQVTVVMTPLSGNAP